MEPESIRLYYGLEIKTYRDAADRQSGRILQRDTGNIRNRSARY